jgi:D-alanyl-D-alanine dipeptidase
MKCLAKIIGFLVLLASNCDTIQAQEKAHNYHGLKVINTTAEYLKSVEKDSIFMLVSIPDFIPDLVLDIRYATENNFTRTKVYDSPGAYARLPVVLALAKAHKECKQYGLGIKLYDAYRPYSATLKFFGLASNKSFVAAPWTGSRHNRGCALDITLIILATGEELPMPTAFDDFTERAHPNFTDLPNYLLAHRNLLIEIMKKHGFEVFHNEWWHYDFKGWEKFPLMDLNFTEIKTANNTLKQ